MTDETVDLDVSKYTVEDILSIFNLVDPTVFNVTDVANSLIAKMTTGNNPAMVDFFTEARDKVLDYLKNMDKEPVDNESTDKIEDVWSGSFVFRDKNPKDPALYYGENGRETIAQKAVEKTLSGEPVISTTIIIIDSQFRSNILPYSNNQHSNAFNTNFTFNLTSQLSKAISMKLYSYHIPTSWNAFAATSGNTFFLYNGVIINIPDGNYVPETLVTAIMAQAALNIATSGLEVNYNANINRISFTNTDPLLDVVSIMFFIQSNTVSFSDCGNFILSNFQTIGVNTTLGWLLGFRTPQNALGDMELLLPPNIETFADVPPDTYGPKYFTLNIEDYSNQRLTGGMYNITNTKQYASISVQEYYNTNEVACQLREGSLTQAQIYAINSVISNSKLSNGGVGVGNNTLNGPTASATFAVIPLANIQQIRPYPYVRFGSDLYVYKRNYIKPSSIQRLNVSLKDDKGNYVNLYDNDWSFTLIVEQKLN
jgi:hypothetical protein